MGGHAAEFAREDIEKEILNLCEELANCKFESIDKMLKDKNQRKN